MRSPIRRSLISPLLALAATLGLVLVAGSASPAAELTVMTYNLRYASKTPPNAWPDRLPIMKELIATAKPDVLGTQEGLYPQLQDLAAGLPEYRWIGLGRDGGSRGEFMAVFYRPERLEPLAYDHFWLSDTPEVIASSTWGNTNRRMVTWVRFLDRLSGREFFFWNTHLDHALQPAREKGAELIRRRIDALHTDLPVLLVGDFNAVSGANKAYDILTADGFLRDTWPLAGERRNAEITSFNDFKPARTTGQRIDWILLRGSGQVRATEILTFDKGGQYPSDHFPIIAWMELK